MSLQDALAIGALFAGVLAVPAAWIVYRSGRRERHSETFRLRLAALQNDHVRLSREMLEQSPSEWKLNDFPMLSQDGWVPESPFDLDEIQLEWKEPDEPDDLVEVSRRSASKLVSPLALRGANGYSAALTRVGGLHLFNGRIYRLLEVEFSESVKRMLFTEGVYFDYLDTSEVLTFEAQLRDQSNTTVRKRSSYRRRLRSPFDFRNRVASLGIDTLTIRVEAQSAGFFLHRRDPARVVNNSSLIGVCPAGEFTPSDMTYEAVKNDLTLWRNVMREFAEEFLGAEEAQGRGGSWINYDEDSPYGELSRGRDAGRIRIKVLGFGIDPLPWKPELLTVCLIDADCFDAIFDNMLDSNDEGLLLKGKSRKGLPFDNATVTRYCNGRDISPNAKACLQLAWRHRSELGLG